MSDLLNSVLDDIDTGAFDPSAPLKAEPVDINQPNPINDAIDTIAGQSQTGNGLAVLKSSKANPDKYEDQKKLAERFNVPVDFVSRNEDILKSKEAQEDISKLLLENPDIAEWYKGDDNTAAIKVDELRELSGLSWLWNSALQAAGAGSDQVDLAQARFNQLSGIATNEEIARADYLSSMQENRTFGADSWLEKGWTGAAQQLPILMEIGLEAISGGAIGAGAGAGLALVAGQLGPQVATPEELITVPGAAAIGFSRGAQVGAFAGALKLEAGLAYDEFKNFKDENGQPLDDGVARIAALVSGGTSAGFELVGLNALLKTVPGVKDLKSLVGREAVKNALKNVSVRTALSDFSKNVFKSGVTEISTEILQEATMILAGEAAKTFQNSQGGSFQGIEGDEVVDRLTEVAIHTAQTMTILGPGLSSTKLGVDLAKVSKFRKESRIIEALNAHAEGSEFNERLPEKNREAIAKLTENGPVQNIYIAPEGFTELFQDDAELADFAERAGITEELREAMETGRDVEIPIGTYMSSIAGTEAAQALNGFTKLSQDGFNNEDAEAFNEEWEETTTELSNNFQKEQANEQASLEGAEKVADDVKTRAMNAGIVPDQAEQYAQLYSKVFSVLGEKTNQDPDEIFKKYGFEIRRPIPELQEFKEINSQELAFEMVRRNQIDAVRKKADRLRGHSILGAIKAQGGITDPGGDLASLGLPASQIVKETTGELPLKGKTSGKAVSQDDTALRLWENGYFPEFQERPSINDLLDAIGDELSGNETRYSSHETINPELKKADDLVSFVDALDEFGLDPNEMTDAELTSEIEKINNGDPDTGAAFQSDPYEVDGWNDIKLDVKNEDGDIIEVTAGELETAVLKREESARKLLDCINA